ncbi:MAG: glycosyltransferase [Clostridium sp.]|nr:glycosyltransferase [Clostridium sp.]
MKVLQINSVCGTGSTGRIAVDLYKTLVENGHESMIAFGRNTALGNVNNVKIGSNVDNYIHVAKTRIFDKHGFGSTKATKEFIKTIEEYNPDIIHLHNIHGYYINIEILFNYLKEINKPVVWTLHDCWTFTGHCAYFDDIGCEKWKSQCYDCCQLNSYPISKIKDNSKGNYICKKAIFNGVNGLKVITVSSWLKGKVEQSFLKDYDIRVINNGIDVDTFKPLDSKDKIDKKYNIQGKKIILGVSNIWDERKGLKDFLKLSQIIDDSFVIVLVGLNDDQIKELPSNIIGIRRTENIEELAELYSAAMVLVNTSVEETFGLVTVEAMACGTPVIVYNSTALPEEVGEKCGYVVEKRNVSQVIDAIKKIDIEGKEYFAEHCRNRVKSLYRKQDKYQEYMNLYKEILDISQE